MLVDFVTLLVLLFGPADIELVSVGDCPGSTNHALELNIDEYKVNKMHYIKGNVTLSTNIDDDVMITLKGVATNEDPFQEEKTYINHKSVCRIIDNYLQEYYFTNSMTTACPIPSGYYDISDKSLLLSEMNLPYEMLGHRKFRIELKKHDELLACKIFHLKNTADVILDLYEIYEKDSM